MKQLSFRLSEPRYPRDAFGLTPRQHEIANLLSRDHSTEQIAKRLYVTTETVKGHLTAIYKQLGVSSRADAIKRIKRG